LDKKDRIYKILKYYYTDDLTQVEIADKLNITRVAVSRYLSRAKKDGLIEFKIKYPSNFTLNQYENIELEFKKVFNLKECIIVPSHVNPMETLQELAYMLDELFDSIISNNTFLGVGWGSTLDKIANLMEIHDKKNIRVIPLIGGYGRLFDDQHSNNIAKLISKKFNGTCYVVNIPSLFDSKEIKESIEKDSTVIELFKLAKRVDAAILCMGDLTTESSLYKTGQINLEDINNLKKLGIVGDINGIFLDKDGNFTPNDLSERLTNIFPAALMKSTKNVIGVAIGARKAGILRAVLKGNLINILLTDIDAAAEVMKQN
jgi:DNA-binding transcriptional regulator LsrR (DeoR family)